MTPAASDGWTLQLVVAVTGAEQRAGVLARLCPFPSYGNTNSHIESSCLLRELADMDFASVQNFVKLGLYLKKFYDIQQAS